MGFDLSSIADSKAEAGIVSTLIYHPDFILHSPSLRAKFFYFTDNACIYWAIQELFNEKITNISALNIEHMINSNEAVRKKLKEFNFPNIQEYVDLCFYNKRDSIEEYKLLVRRVMELAFKRDLYRQTEMWQRACLDENKGLDTLSNDVYKELSDLTTRFITDGEITTIGSKARTILAQIRERKARGESYGFPSYFEEFCGFFHYEKKELTVIEARMKKGKSWIAMIEAYHKAVNGITTLVQDSEMSDDQWLIRLAAYVAGIYDDEIKYNTLSPEQERKLDEAITHIESLPLYHNFDPYITKEKFYSLCAQKKIEDNLEFVIWDYIKCDDSILDSAMRSAYMGGMANWLKNTIAGDLDLAVLAFCQLNRNNEVAESDGIERYCSVAVKWQEKTSDEIIDDGESCGTHKFTVKLNRLGRSHQGEKDYIDMRFCHGRPGIMCAEQHSERTPFD